MKPSFFPALSLVIIFLLAPAWGQKSSAVDMVYVYKPDGTRHCDTTEGISLDAMARELIRSSISVYTQRNSHDGREGIAICGSPTGSINVYEIKASDLPQALQLGSQRLDPSWFDAR